MLICLKSIIRLMPESYCSDSRRGKRVSYVLFLALHKTCHLSQRIFYFVCYTRCAFTDTQSFSAALQRQAGASSATFSEQSNLVPKLVLSTFTVFPYLSRITAHKGTGLTIPKHNSFCLFKSLQSMLFAPCKS